MVKLDREIRMVDHVVADTVIVFQLKVIFYSLNIDRMTFTRYSDRRFSVPFLFIVIVKKCCT